MPVTTDFFRVPINSGGITSEQAVGPTVYSVDPFTNQYLVGHRAVFVPTVLERRMFAKFDTSMLGPSAIILSVELSWRVRFVLTSVIPPLAWAVGFQMGTWLGGTLDPTSADFNGGTIMSDHIYTNPTNPTGDHRIFIQPQPTAVGLVNPFGFTDIAWRDQSAPNLGSTEWYQAIAWTSAVPILHVTHEGGGTGGGLNPSSRGQWTPF